MATANRKVNRASTLIEATAALALVISVTFVITTQDTLSLNQATRDARLAAAQLFLENETSLIRSSLPPWAPTNALGVRPHLSLYGDTVGTPKVYTNVSLVGDAGERYRGAAVAGGGIKGMTGIGWSPELGAYPARFRNCVVTRSLIDLSEDSYDGLVFATYQVDVDVPYSLIISGEDVDKNRMERLSRTVSRVFYD